MNSKKEIERATDASAISKKEKTDNACVKRRGIQSLSEQKYARNHSFFNSEELKQLVHRIDEGNAMISAKIPREENTERNQFKINLR